MKIMRYVSNIIGVMAGMFFFLCLLAVIPLGYKVYQDFAGADDLCKVCNASFSWGHTDIREYRVCDMCASTTEMLARWTLNKENGGYIILGAEMMDAHVRQVQYEMIRHIVEHRKQRIKWGWK